MHFTGIASVVSVLSVSSVPMLLPLHYELKDAETRITGRSQRCGCLDNREFVAGVQGSKTNRDRTQVGAPVSGGRPPSPLTNRWRPLTGVSSAI
jgi:hypothetical protein